MHADNEWNLDRDAAPGARFVSPDEYRDGKTPYVSKGLLLNDFTDALADAADENGMLLDFDQRSFHTGPLTERLRNDEDRDFTLSYDRFAAFAVMDLLNRLCLAGLLAAKGQGDVDDYRLTLPADTNRAN